MRSPISPKINNPHIKQYNHKMKKIFLIATATLALAACDNNEDNPATSPVAAK